MKPRLALVLKCLGTRGGTNFVPKQMKLKRLFVFFIFSLQTISTASWAAPHPLQILLTAKKTYSSPEVCFGPDVIQSYNQVKSDMKPVDFSQIVPLDLVPSDDSNRVFSKIADHSLSSLFNSDAMRATPLGQTATEVEQKMKQDLILADQGRVQHKLTINVQAFQTLAKIDYSGFTNASLQYQARDSSLNFEVSEKINRTRDLILGHLQKPSDRISSMSVRWSF